MKMSEVLKDVAEPWFRRTGPDVPIEIATAIYEIVGLIWNVSRLRDAPGSKARLTEVAVLVREALPTLDTKHVCELVHEIHWRALERYPDEDRAVVSTEVTISDAGAPRLFVVSARASE